MSNTWLPLAAATAFFTLLHLLALAVVEPKFPRAFKLSRGLAAAMLTGVGAAALLGAADRWDQALLYRHPRGDWMRLGLLAVYGHLLSDFLWMLVGRLRFAIIPRKDLMIHHGLGVLGFGAALVLHVGYAFALATMVTEMLPVTTGLGAWAKRIGSARLEDFSNRFRLWILAFLRIPLWILLEVLVLRVLIAGESGALLPAYLCAAAGMIALLCLDRYWIGKCRQRVDFY